MFKDDSRLISTLTSLSGLRRRMGGYRYGGSGIRIGRVTLLKARLERIALSFVDSLQRDLDMGRGAAWLVVSFAAGIWLYFELPREPQLWATGSLALVLAGAAVRRRQRGYRALVTLMLAAMASGLALADLRTTLVAAPRLEAAGAYDITGWVEAVEPREVGYRITVRPLRLGEHGKDALPMRIRVTARAGEPPRAGEAVAMRAHLSTPQGPVEPGGYAFDRASFFDRIGGFGFVYGRVKPVTVEAHAPWDLALWARLARWRLAIGERVRASVDGDAGAIAAALIVGERGAVSKQAQENLRIAGLAHVLAISGMHMALVAGTIFFFLRAIFALSPGLAMERPIRAWAAAAALFAATAYLGLSGGSIATQRAYAMAGVVFLAMIFNRPALTMRSVALAAAGVLVLSPEALLQPGFQMSFAAVIALVATYRAWSQRGGGFGTDRGGDDSGGNGEDGQSIVVRVRNAAAVWIGGLIVTSLIAGIATAPIAIVHFARASPLGLVANMAAMPLVSVVIMPCAVLSVLLMPFGLDPLALRAMGAGIDGMLAVAQTVARWTPGQGLVGALPDTVAILFAAGLLWLALWHSRWRLLGLAPIAAAVIIALFAGTKADVLISSDGRTVAIRDAHGHLAVATGRGGTFAARVWLRADGDTAGLAKRKAHAPLMRCDAFACVLTIPASADGRRALTVSRVLDPRAFAEDCRRADIVVTPLKAPPGCAARALVIDADYLAIHGAVAIEAKARERVRPARHARDHFSDPHVPPSRGANPAFPAAAFDATLASHAPTPSSQARSSSPWESPSSRNVSLTTQDANPVSSGAPIPSRSTAARPPHVDIVYRLTNVRAGRYRPWQSR